MASPDIIAFPGSPRLRSWERAGLVVLAVVILAFAALVELRSAFQDTRKTDFGVYARAAWAVRSGADLYGVVDDNRYHYTYPPAFAVVMAPLADAPPGVPRDGLMPFWASVLIWTLFNMACVARAAHVMAALVLPTEPRGTRRWWYARTMPAYIAIGGIGFSIGFGQVNVPLVAMLVEMLRASVQGKSFRSGLWLAAAIVIKVMPAYLVLFPLLKKDGRALGGVMAGLVIGFALIPLAGLGVERTAAGYDTWISTVLQPGALGGDAAGLKELVDMPSNDNQSFLAVIHSALHPVRVSQPAVPSRETKFAHAALAVVLTLVTIVTAARRDLSKPADQLLLLGTLSALMLHIVPMSHMHYYAFGWPLAAGLWLKGQSQRPHSVFAPARIAVPLAVWAFATALPLLPGPSFELLRNHGLGVAATLALWAIGVRQLGEPHDAVMVVDEPLASVPELRRAA
jgi:hypothetical protein